MSIFVEDAVYASIFYGARRRTVRVLSNEFTKIVAMIAKRDLGKRPSATLIKNVVDTVAGLCTELNERQPIACRYAWHDGALWIDLCDTDGNVVKLDSSGWRIVHHDQCGVLFCRTTEMRSLPIPARGGSIDELRPFAPVSANDFPRLVGWILGSMIPGVTVPILILVGPQDSAKSTASRFLLKLIDDRYGAPSRLPWSREDVFVLARTRWLQCFENGSAISRSVADALCTLVTSGARARRRRHSDLEPSVVEARRPVLINGREAFLGHEEFADRSMVIEMESISAEQRRGEVRMNEAFEMAQPRIFGALLDALVLVLRNREAIHLADTGRVLDFQQAVASGEIAFGWEPGTFEHAVDVDRLVRKDDAVTASDVGFAVRVLLEEEGTFNGTPTQLHKALLALGIGPTADGFEVIPCRPQQMMQQLNRVAPALSAIGILVESGKKSPLGKRVVNIRWAEGMEPPDSETTEKIPLPDLGPRPTEAGVAACTGHELDKLDSGFAMTAEIGSGQAVSAESNAAAPTDDTERLPTNRVRVTDDAHSSDRSASWEQPEKPVDEDTSLEQKSGGTL